MYLYIENNYMDYMIDSNETDTFLACFAPNWGYRDIECALEAYEEAGKDEVALADDVKTFAEDTGIKLDDIDVCYVAYDNLYQEARTDIESATNMDISNDSPYDAINISGNYMCTTIDGLEKDLQALADLIKTIPENDRTPVTTWLLNQIDV